MEVDHSSSIGTVARWWRKFLATAFRRLQALWVASKKNLGHMSGREGGREGDRGRGHEAGCSGSASQRHVRPRATRLVTEGHNTRMTIPPGAPGRKPETKSAQRGNPSPSRATRR